MAAGKHSKGKHSRPRGSRREIIFPRGPKDPAAAGETAVPEEIAKTAAGKMQTADAVRDEQPTGEAATVEALDEWVADQRRPEPEPGDAEGERSTKRSARRKGAIAIAIVVVVIVAALVVAGIAVFANIRPANTPSQVARTALEAVKSNDAQALSDIYAGNADNLQSRLTDALASGAGLGSESALESKLNDEQKKVLDRVEGELRDFDYTVDSTSEDGNTATVAVTFTTRDFGSYASNVLGTYIADGLAAASKDHLESDADAATRFVGDLQQHEDELGGKSKSAQTQLVLTRGDDGSWKLSELSDDALDALTGGLISTTDEMARQLESGTAS